MHAFQPAAGTDPRLQSDTLVHLELVDSEDVHWHYLCRTLWVTPRGIGLRLPSQAVLPDSLGTDSGLHISQVTIGGMAATTLVSVVASAPLVLAIGIDEAPASPASPPTQPWYEAPAAKPPRSEMA